MSYKHPSKISHLSFECVHYVTYWNLHELNKTSICSADELTHNIWVWNVMDCTMFYKIGRHRVDNNKKPTTIAHTIQDSYLTLTTQKDWQTILAV